MGEYKFEELSNVLDRTIRWIENCDSKASTILGVEGVILSIVLASDYVKTIFAVYKYMISNLNFWTGLYLTITLFSVIALCVGTIFLIKVLGAKIDSSEFQNREVQPDSVIFFGTISENKSLEDYNKKLRGYSSLQMDDDLISQIYICSLICKLKFELYKKGVVITESGLFVFMITMFIGVLNF